MIIYNKSCKLHTPWAYTHSETGTAHSQVPPSGLDQTANILIQKWLLEKYLPMVGSLLLSAQEFYAVRFLYESITHLLTGMLQISTSNRLAFPYGIPMNAL